MLEAKIQHDLIMWFGQIWPNLRPLLFEVNNDTFSAKNASFRKSKGMISGVADLILIKYKAGIELKAPGTVHSKKHIEKQLNWGHILIENKGYYLITSDLGVAKNFITQLVLCEYDEAIKIQTTCLELVKNQFENKTIKF